MTLEQSMGKMKELSLLRKDQRGKGACDYQARDSMKLTCFGLDFGVETFV